MFKVYACSIFFVEVPERNVNYYKFISSKKRVYNYFRNLGYVSLPQDDVDIILKRIRFYNEAKKTFVHVTEEEVDNL